MSDFVDTLAGVAGVLVTPFSDSDELATDRLWPIVNNAIGAGVHTLTVNGNVGEFFALSMGEAERMVSAVTEMADGRVPVVAGVGRSIGEAEALAAHSAEVGASAIMVHQPTDTYVSPRGLVDYVTRIGEAAPGLPLLVYIRNDGIGSRAIELICRVKPVVAVQWATPNPLKLAAAKAAAPDDIFWIGGLAETFAAQFWSVGARGFTSGLINIWPDRAVAIYSALARGDNTRAARLIEEIKLFEDIRSEEMGGTNVTAVKGALDMLGWSCGHARPPSAWPLKAEQSERLRLFLERIGLTDGAVAG